MRPAIQFLWLNIEGSSFPLGVITELVAQMTQTCDAYGLGWCYLVDLATTENLIDDTLLLDCQFITNCYGG